MIETDFDGVSKLNYTSDFQAKFYVYLARYNALHFVQCIFWNYSIDISFIFFLSLFLESLLYKNFFFEIIFDLNSLYKLYDISIIL